MYYRMEPRHLHRYIRSEVFPHTQKPAARAGRTAVSPAVDFSLKLGKMLAPYTASPRHLLLLRELSWGQNRRWNCSTHPLPRAAIIIAKRIVSGQPGWNMLIPWMGWVHEGVRECVISLPP
jgi:hypothetical protein